MIALAKLLPFGKRKAAAKEKSAAAKDAGRERKGGALAARALGWLKAPFASRRALVVTAAAAGSLAVAAAAGGAAWWLLGDRPAASAAGASSGPRVAIAMPAPAKAPELAAGGLAPPPRAGGLNQFVREGEQPAVTPPPAAGAASAEKPAQPAEPAAVRPAAPAAAEKPAAPAPVEQAAEAAAEPASGAPGFQAALGGGSLNVMAQKSVGAAGEFTIPALTVASFARYADLPPAQPLPAAPDPSLVEESPQGPLPKIGKDKKPWQAYAARAQEAGEDRPRVAVVVTGLGLSRAASMAAIGKLPPQVSLAFSPYATDLTEWMIRARRAGHEVLVALPMESDRFPFEDAGPLGLRADSTAEENMKRLELVLSRFGGYAGVVGTMGSRFKTSEAQLKPILEALKARGLMYVEGSGPQGSLAPRIAGEIGLPKAVADVDLEQAPTRAGIEAKLAEAEAVAQQRKAVVVTTELTPASLDRLVAWIAALQVKKIALVPVTALADKQ